MWFLYYPQLPSYTEPVANALASNFCHHPGISVTKERHSQLWSPRWLHNTRKQQPSEGQMELLALRNLGWGLQACSYLSLWHAEGCVCLQLYHCPQKLGRINLFSPLFLGAHLSARGIKWLLSQEVESFGNEDIVGNRKGLASLMCWWELYQ